jgi:hypothetical protein
VLATGASIAAAAIALPHGTWHTKRRDTRTFAEIDAHHAKKLVFWGDPGFGLEDKIVADAKKAKLFTARSTAAFTSNVRWVKEREALGMMKDSTPKETLISGKRREIPSGGNPRASRRSRRAR